MQHNVIQDFLNDLKKNISGELRTDSYSLMLYSTDASIYQVKPYGVLNPRRGRDGRPAGTEIDTQLNGFRC